MPKKRRKSDLPQVTQIGISIWDPVWAVKEHVSGAHELVHVLNGSVTLRIDGKRYKGVTGDTLIIPEGKKHKDEFPLDSKFKVMHVMFIWNEFLSVMPADANRSMVRFPSAEKQEIKELIKRIYDMFREDKPFARERMNGCLYDCIYLIASAVKTLGRTRKKGAVSGKKQTMINEAKRFIHENFQKPISLACIAKHLRLSEYYLSHLFSEETGFTLSSYVTCVRMDVASGLLGDPTARISEVAYAVGYEDPHYFGKAFRKHFGHTPGSLRTRIRKQNRNI